MTPRILIDLHLVFDFWSLLFSVGRQVIFNVKKLSLNNEAYSHIVNFPISQGILNLQRNYDLSDEDALEIQNLFKHHIQSIKPWLPYN